MRRFFTLITGLAVLAAFAPRGFGQANLQPGTYATLHTSLGPIVCKLQDKYTPKTVANFIGLATGTKEWLDPVTKARKKTPLYKDLLFHRIIPGFMIQTGDPTGTGRGGPGYTFMDEILPGLRFDRPGRLAMANVGEPHTNGSQFFITEAPTPHLNGQHTIFGEVVSGMEVVRKIARSQSQVRLEKITIERVGKGDAPSGK